MKIAQIESQRQFNNLQYWQIVYDWENIIASHFNIEVKQRSKLNHYLTQIIPHFSNSGLRLIFDMGTRFRRVIPLLRAKSDMIPLIIDFWCNDAEIPSFVKAYKKAPLVLVSSRQAYDYIMSKNVPLRIEHLPLSIPDDLIQASYKPFEQKKYDLVLAGRPSRVFMGYLERYKKDNPGLKIVTRKWVDNKSIFYGPDGEMLVVADSREQYLELIRDSKVFLYSTPGIDDDKRTNGFSQVTPRFLEGVSAGCNMLLRYPDNSDVRYYELEKFCPSIDSYEAFRTRMNKAIITPPDLVYYRQYLDRHSTSNTAKLLEEILKRY